MPGSSLLSRRPPEATPREQVQVDVKYRLTGFAVTVEDSTVPSVGITLLGRDCRGKPQHASEEPFVRRAEVVQGRNVTPRDDQRVQRRLRVNVVEGDELIVLADDRRWNLTACNPAEETVVHIR
jgi:hypothetical protein